VAGLYRVYEVIDYVRIPPNRFGEPVDTVAEEYLREKYESKFNKDLGIIILVYDVNVSEMGIILPGDGGIYHEARFKMLCYVPVLHEIVEGVVRDARNIGLFVNIGPLDAFVHISQVMDADDIEYNEAFRAIVGDKNRKQVGVGDKVRGRITNISHQAAGLPRIAMTMRQPSLGKIEWIEGGQ
jgi:DNA-directed RNA polymerase subunit E'